MAQWRRMAINVHAPRFDSREELRVGACSAADLRYARSPDHVATISTVASDVPMSQRVRELGGPNRASLKPGIGDYVKIAQKLFKRLLGRQAPRYSRPRGAIRYRQLAIYRGSTSPTVRRNQRKTLLILKECSREPWIHAGSGHFPSDLPA